MCFQLAPKCLAQQVIDPILRNYLLNDDSYYIHRVLIVWLRCAGHLARIVIEKQIQLDVIDKK